MKTTLVKAYDDGNGIGIMRFRPNPDLPTIHERSTNELWDIFVCVARSMALDKFYGHANVYIESGRHAGTSMSVTITEPTLGP